MSHPRVLLDSSVVIALLDPHDAHHGSVRPLLEPLRPEDVVISVLTLAEVMVGAFARGGPAVKAADDFLRAATGRVEPVTQAIARRGARLRASHRGLRLTDALVIATGEELRVETMLTADARWRSVSGLVEVVG